MERYYLVAIFINEDSCVEDLSVYVFDSFEDAHEYMVSFYNGEIETCINNEFELYNKGYLNKYNALIQYDERVKWIFEITNESPKCDGCGLEIQREE